jgi:dihydroceramidase
MPLDPFYHRHIPEAHDMPKGMHGEPFWGASTSSVDWCEANYARSAYVAEFWNTLSSLPLVVVMVYGLVKCHQHGIEWRFRLCYVALGLVGCGSTAFHATMTHAGQASDELSMIYGGLVFLHAALEIEQRERTWSALATPLMELAYALLFTAAYFRFPEYFGAFVVCYILLIAVILKQTYRAYLRYLAEAGTDAGFYQTLLFRFSFGTYAFGFLALWVPENALCPYFPHHLQWLNLHAFFHLTSTIAPYNLLVFLTFHRMRILRRHAEHRFDGGLVIYIHTLDNDHSSSSNRNQNASGNGGGGDSSNASSSGLRDGAEDISEASGALLGGGGPRDTGGAGGGGDDEDDGSEVLKTS